MSSKKGTTVFVLMLLCMGVAIYFFASRKVSQTASGDTALDSAVDVSESKNGEVVYDLTTSAERDTPSGPESRPKTSPIDSMKIGDPLEQPKTQREVDWLVRNGFPSEREFYKAANSHILPTDFSAQDGFDGYEISLAENYAIKSPQDFHRAGEFLTSAATDGSIYALLSLAQIYGNGAHKNPVLSEAYLRAATLRGYWKGEISAGGAIRPLTKEQKMIAGLMAHQILLNIDRERGKRGLRPLRYDPYPGLDEALKEIMKAYTNSSSTGP